MQNNYLTEQDTIIKNEKLIADTFNNYFADITKTLKLKKHPNFDGQSLFSITDYFKNNESVIKIKEKYDTQKNSFLFTLFSKEDILKAIKSLSSNKAFLDVTPMFRKINHNESTLSAFSKVFEKLLLMKKLMNYYSKKLMNICKVNSQGILQVFAETTALKMIYLL